MTVNEKSITLVTKSLTQSQVIFVNETSNVECIRYKDIKLVLAEENQVTLLIPPNTCTIGHHLFLFIFQNDKQLRNMKRIPKDRSVMKCITLHGTVTELFSIDDSITEVTLKITDKVMEYWQGIIKNIDTKQDQVSELFWKYRT